MTFLPHRLSIAAISLVALVLAQPATARAANETPAPVAYLAAYNLDWVNYIAPADLPATPYSTCIVDTGTLITPDTPDDNPAGPILERVAIDDGSGQPQGTTEANLHGTRMAMAAAAPTNGWGTIGTAGWTRVVSVRATVENETTFRYDAFRAGLYRCQLLATRHSIATASLSLGCRCDISDEEQTRLDDRIEKLHGLGISVVAAAGNEPAAATQAPARYPGVFAVGGGNGAGGLCSYSTFDARVDTLGPACPVAFADPFTGDWFPSDAGGSSTATATTASFLTALRSLAPAATWQQVEEWVRTSARVVGGRRVLDGEAAARLAGLGGIVDRARARMPEPAPPPPTPTPIATARPTATPRVPQAHAEDPAGASTPRPERFGAPRCGRGRWVDGHLMVRVTRRPAGAKLEVVAEQVGDLGIARRSVRRSAASRLVAFRLRWQPDRLKIRFVPAREFAPKASRQRILHRRFSHRFS